MGAKADIIAYLAGRYFDGALPAASVAAVRGRARGGGAEFTLACDIRFASLERAIFTQIEVGTGLISIGGAVDRLSYLMGRDRALEVILGSDDFDAALQTARDSAWRWTDTGRLRRKRSDSLRETALAGYSRAFSKASRARLRQAQRSRDELWPAPRRDLE
jgi:enoyl-CoA hydratase/carnithine racemase